MIGIDNSQRVQLLHAEAQLRAEANQVAAELGITALLSTVGNPVRTGSSALGLMVRRDIDTTVICEKLDVSTQRRMAEVGATLASRPGMRQVVFRNDVGPLNADPAAYPDGLYLGLTYLGRDGVKWNFDIWAVDDPDRMPDLAHLRTLPPRLDDQSRATILSIKTYLAEREARVRPSSDVYRAVLDDGVGSTAEYDVWCLTHR